MYLLLFACHTTERSNLMVVDLQVRNCHGIVCNRRCTALYCTALHCTTPQ
jgi:hypothetical protein